MKFTKMHGIGNDYVYINGFEEQVSDPAALAQVMADRHFGVGGDGLILVLPSRSPGGADVRMRMFNADGSEAEMCGNGIRCVCKLAHDHGITRAKPMRIETGAGILTLDYLLDETGKIATVTVNMGKPRLTAEEIPVSIQGVAETDQVLDLAIEGLFDFSGLPCGDWQKQVGLDPRMTCVSMGNPHAVLYCKDVAAVPLEQVGPVMETASCFPARMNIHFVQKVSDSEVIMRTWERGSGITLACGTGACAVCVAGVLTGHTGRELLAHLPGGDLQLHWREDEHVMMTGPATEVFQGDWPR